VDIFVDEQPYQPAGGSDRTVGELANEVAGASQAAPRMVVSVRCDGEPVSQENLDQILTQPLSDFAKLELHTQPRYTLIEATLTQAIALFEEAGLARIRTADLLAEGKAETAMHHLQKFFDIWKQVQQCTLVCAQALDVDLDALQVDGQGLVEIFEPLKTRLNELKEAMVNHDFVVLGDILRYEFEESFESWSALLNQLREQAEVKVENGESRIES